jgi:hypothetical protein
MAEIARTIASLERLPTMCPPLRNPSDYLTVGAGEKGRGGSLIFRYQDAINGQYFHGSRVVEGKGGYVT